MKKNLKEIIASSKGITLISLIITIVILLILSTAITIKSIESIKKSKLRSYVAQMQIIQKKVDLMVQGNQEYITLGQPISTNPKSVEVLQNAYNNQEIKTQYQETNEGKYRYFSKTDIKEDLGLDNIEYDVIVNFQTREIVSIYGIEHNGITYNSQYKLPGGQQILNITTPIIRELTDITTKVTIDGLNATINISNINIANGKLEYKFNEGLWQTITNYTKENANYEIIVSVSGSYTIRITDNTNSATYKESEVNIVLTNAPKLETNMELNNTTYNYTNYKTNSTTWAFATDENGLIYVWVPRFAYDTNENIKFIRGNSNIATDETYIDETWTIPPLFTTTDGEELTGIWKNIINIDVNLKLLDLVI